MIHLTRLNGQRVVINAELIESIEQQTLNTVISLTNGNKILVKDTVEEIIRKVTNYRGEVLVESERIKSQQNK
ncbi:MAG TPA: endoflagellar protein [Elusimicrobia bacterium]|jgi:flagellar protein FlbD|nr:endoflagellar protein [Elusimicrobiota bacterium]